MLTTRQKIALARSVQAPLLALRRIAGLGPECRARRRGIEWQLDLREGIDFSIYLLGAFEPATVAAYERLVTPGMTVLDIGANVGAHTLHLARLVGRDGHVYAFEPTQWAIGKLTANLRRNPILAERVALRQVMLVDTVEFRVPGAIASSWPLAAGDDVHPLLRARSMPTDGADATTLDSFVTDAGIRRVDFIKMDVDGYECQVLGGMLDTLRRFRPPILMEFSPYGLAEKGGSLERMVSLMDSAGYRFFHLNGTAPLPADVDALDRLVSEGAGMNIIARSVSA